jgi:Tol biopolymer transport system component
VTHGETTSIELIDSVSGERRKISTPELSAQFPVWSPDSHQLMYTADPGPKQPLAARNYIYDVRTGTQSQWSDQHTGWTDWSINGELVFTRWTGKSFDLFRARSDGSDLVNLTNTDDRDEDIPAWSVDGTQIAFTAYPRGQTQQRQLFVMLRDGSGLRQLVAIPGASSNPIWLADGRSIAFANQPSEDTWQPWLVASNGSNARQLSQNSDRIWFLGRIDRH